MSKELSAVRVGQLRALVASLEEYPDDLPITIHFAHRLGASVGLEVADRDESTEAPLGLVLSIDRHQSGYDYKPEEF